MFAGSVFLEFYMESMILTPRLACMAALVPPNARLADIGTDHGLSLIHICIGGGIKGETRESKDSRVSF